MKQVKLPTKKELIKIIDSYELMREASDFCKEKFGFSVFIFYQIRKKYEIESKGKGNFTKLRARRKKFV